jgi:hypothetical protein
LLTKNVKVKMKIKLLLYSLVLFAALAFTPPPEAQAQKSFLSSFNLTSDTVVNTATAYLQTTLKGGFDETIIQVVVTEISGTTAGTVSILGSLDGTNFIALKLEEVTTALPTFAPADQAAAQTYMWRIKGNPSYYYRVSYTGAGTMSAKFSAKAITH